MILAATLVPHPPLLLRELGGAQDPVADLRAAVLDAVRDVTAGADEVVVVGPAPASGTWDAADPFDVGRYGARGPRPGRPGLPLSLGVGRRVLREAGWSGPVELVSVASAAATPELEVLAVRLADRPGRTALLLLGDGGPAAALGLDVVLAEEPVVPGAATFRLLGAVALAAGTTYETALGYRDDPYGVSYVVATWRFSGER